MKGEQHDGSVASAQLADLADDYWQHQLRTNPTWASLLGDHRYDTEIEDPSRRAEDEYIAALEGFVATAEAIDPSRLTTDDRITRGVLIEEASGEAALLRTRFAELDINPSFGVHISLLQLVAQLPLTEPGHAEAVVERYAKVGDLFAATVERLGEGVARDRTPPKVAVDKSIVQIDAYLASPNDDDPFLGLSAPEAFSPADEAAWREKLALVVDDVIRPAYAALRTALADEIAPAARPPERSGVGWLADGDEMYRAAIRRHTSLDLAPADVHQIGLGIMEALADEYRKLGAKVLGMSDLEEIFHRLRHDPELRFGTADEIVAAAQGAMDRARDAIPRWFGRLPRTACEMEEIPGPGAEQAPLAYYLPPAPDGSRPGRFFVNTTEPATRTRYESEALAFHESIPGHHLQIAIAQELDGIPEFRKHALLNSYVEGWGLYTERLADEMGLYSSDMARFGMLSFDSWRAGRLVVDTGIHALGWSRRQAIDWLTANTPQAPNNIETEVDRYIGWPGQALGYMVGRREIMRLRREAELAMGDRFDLAEFHDTVLGSGPVPLGMLGELVETWMAP